MELLSLDSLPPNLRDSVSIRKLVTGQKLFQAGDLAKSFFIIETGRFKLIRYLDNSNVVNLEFAQTGEILGDRSFFSEMYDTSAIALVNSTVIVYPKQIFRSSLREYPDLAADFIAILVKKIQSLQINLELHKIKPASERLLQYLKYTATDNDRNIVRLDRPYQEIALELGFTPETFSRALLKLEQEGSIERRCDRIVLYNTSAA
ncbi:MAG: Crp/Fnr family transcriptional regulator [Xenococcaceae cyanobacterium]